jgi:hypothetical protein
MNTATQEYEPARMHGEDGDVYRYKRYTGGNPARMGGEDR